MIHSHNWAGVDGLANFIAASFRKVCRSEGPAGLGMNGRSIGKLLPAPNCAIDKSRFDFDQSRVPCRSLGCNQSGASAAEWIEDDTVQVGTIAHRVRDQRNGLHGGMQR